MPLLRKLPPSSTALDAKKRPIIARAVAFVVLVCISLIAVEGWSSWNAREIKLRETRIATSNMTRALAEDAEHSIKMADIILVGLVERMEVNGTDADSLERLHTLLTMRVAELPLLQALSVYDQHGRRLATSQQMSLNNVGNVNNSDREYFMYHRSHSERGPHVGAPVRIRTNNDWVITVSRRINHPDGSFAGIALAAIKLEHFKNFYDSFDIGRAGTIFLTLDNGILLVRRPFRENDIGRSVADGPIFREYRSKGPVGTAMLTARADNIERLYSYRHLNAYPLIVAAALSKDEILADWWSDTYRLFIGIAILGGVLGFLGSRLIHQISIREKLEAELREAKNALEHLNHSLETLALQDGLTGLANRRQFETTLMAEFRRALRNGSSLALVMLDVDCFKQYNDIYGHPAGDECLRKISEAIKRTQNRPGDLAARYGGEEIAILLPGTDITGALAVAEKIRVAILGLTIEHSGNSFGMVTISAGVDACVPARDGSSALDLVEAADRALYEAKSGGRNRAHCNVKLTTAE